MIEDAYGSTGDANITVTGNTFDNISAYDGAISLQRFTDGTPPDTATINRLSNVDIEGNTFTNLTGPATPTYLNPTYFGGGEVLPASFTGAQILTGTSGNDTITDTSTGAMAITTGPGDDTINGGAGNDALYGGDGIDTATGYSASATIAISGGQWVVHDGADTDTLNGIEKVVINGTTYLLVDHFGPNAGGFQNVQDAIDAASGGEMILVAPGTYTESAVPTEASATAGGLYIDKPDLTLQGVDLSGAAITTAAGAQANGATIIAGAQTDFSAQHFVGVAATNLTIQGLHLQTGAGEFGGKLLEVWADNATIENDFLDVNIGGTDYSFAVAVYFNDNGTTASDNITSYTVDQNILNEGIIVSNGVGNPSAGIGADQLITDNQFEGTFDYGTGLGRYDTVVINGQVAGVGWLLEPTQTPTISGNTFGDNTTPFLLRGSDDSTANLPTATQVQHILDTNGDVNTTYTYVVDSTDGHLITATRDDGFGPYHSFAVTNTIDTLNLSLDTTPDNVFGGQRDYIHAGDTIIVQSGDTGTVDSDIMVEDLKIEATAHSADLNLTLATDYADATLIPSGGVHNVTLLDYAAGLGANVDVTGNGLDNTIVGNSGVNTLDGADGNDTLNGGAGNDHLVGGTGIDTATGYGAGFQAEIQGGQWVVTNGTETDDLTGIERVAINAQTYLLVDHLGANIGGFQTLQDAVDDATGGETILVAAGTYAETVTVDQDVTIEGAQAGVDGRAAGRGIGESVFTDGLRITHDGVTVNGVEVHGSYDSVTIDGTDVPNGVLVLASNVTIENTLFDGSGATDARPFSTSTTVANLEITHDQFENWDNGAYIVAGHSGTIENTDFHDNGNDVLTESQSMTISNNTFENSVGSHVAVLSADPTVDTSAFITNDNTFSNDHPRPISIFPNAPGAETVTGTDYNDNFRGDEGVSPGPFSFDGGLGDDRMVGSNNSDTLVGGAGDDSIDGGNNETVDPIAGSGGDTADYSSSAAALNITLVGGGATGVADGLGGHDTLINIENLTGGSAGDILTGDGSNNILIGGGGVDSLTGAGGDDRLVGGSGADSLSGGTGADIFVYELPSDAGTAAGGEDVISAFSVSDQDAFLFKPGFFANATLPGDFNDGTGHVNSSYFLVANVGDDAAHSYAGSAGQPMFVLDDATAGFAATLWFDADGNGQLNGPNDVKVADLSLASDIGSFSHTQLLLG